MGGNKAFLSLKQRRVLALYRQLFRAIKEVPDKTSQEELKTWVRRDFKMNKDINDEHSIKMLILHGEQALKELRVNVSLAR